MPKSSLNFQKRARGEYEISMQTEDGAIVATVSICNGPSINKGNENEREEAAMKKAARLARAFQLVLE